ncbi:MAG: TIGR00341 family protein [Planctomycetaceae bacterium]
MSLRFLQVFIPENVSVNIEEFLDGHEILGTWRDAALDDRVVVHLLVPAEKTEPIMDQLEQAYAGIDGFCIVLFPVVAMLPRPEVAEEEDKSSSNSDGETSEEESNGDIAESGRVSREELYRDVTETLRINRVFLAMTILSAVVAAVGLLRDDVAVIIGAMVIAPLLGPNVAMSLATTLGDIDLLRRAFVTNLVGVALVFMVAVVLGMVFTVDVTIPAIEARTQANLGDLVLALAAGAAGSFALTRGLTGAVIGVMVAVALVPPLVVCGLLLGGGRWEPAFGAMLLLLVNLTCINLAGVVTFLIQGIRPRTWWEEERARQSSRIALAIWLVTVLALGVLIYLTQMPRSLG